MHTSNLSAFPINSLPPELMCKIFKLANVPNYPAEPPECLSDVQPTKWDAIAVVSAVSRHWRTVALSEPTLWSKISVDGRFGPAILEHLKLQLARSGPSALLDIYFSTDFVAADVVKEALALLIAHVSRWKTVVLFIGLSPEHDDPLLAVIPGSATNLTEIKIDFMNWSVRLQRRVWSLFSTSPSLRGVELRAASELFIPPLLWNSLTSLKLSFFEQADVLYILQHTLALKTLWIDFSVRTLRQVAPITLPVLTELYVSVDHGHAGLLLHYLLAPSLHYLGITHGPYMAEPDEHPYLHHFLLQSQCALHSLTLHDESASEENLLIHLKSPCLRDLKHLRLYGRSQDQIVTGLTLHHDREEGELINLLPSFAKYATMAL